MRILVTGGSGFVGSALGPRLIAEGHDVYSTCRPGSSVGFGKAVEWDVMRRIDAAQFPGDVDAVIHLAQARHYRSFPSDAREGFDVNVGMTFSLLEWAATAGVKHFCLVSSGSVYEPFANALREDLTPSPSGFLGASKLAAETIAKPFSSVLNLNILRLFFPFGPSQRDRLIPDLIRRVREGLPIQVTPNGEGLRLTPSYIGDVADVFVESIARSWCGTINVAAPEALSIRQISDVIGRQLGCAPRLEVVDKAAADIVPSLERLAALYDLKRFSSFDEGLRRTLEGPQPGQPLRSAKALR